MSYKGQKNQYTCNTCGNTITTIDRDEGTTSFMLICLAMEGCDGRMYSSIYRVDQSLTPDWEWYKPESVAGLDSATRQHVEMGGLLIREIED